MRILFLTKRHYTGKDLLGERYGRMYELPKGLVGRGHAVLGVALSYRSDEDGMFLSEPNLPAWHAYSLGRWRLPGAVRYLRRLQALARDFAPEVVLAGSDAPHVIVGRWLARRLGVPLVTDLYDNFESFGLTALPGVRRGFRAAVRAADGVVCVSHSLAELVGECGVTAPLAVVENGVDRRRFRPRDRMRSRRLLGLPEDGRMIGTAGALQAARGIESLYEAYQRLAAEDPSLQLVLAGPLDQRRPPPTGGRIRYLGELSHECAARLFNALDVAVVCNLDSAFGRYCFPQKLHEILACGTPLVAAEVGDTARLLAPFPALGYPPGDAALLAERIRGQLTSPFHPPISVPGWGALAARLEELLLRVVEV